MRSLRSWTFLVFALVLSAPVFAQDWRGSGRVTGWVKDQNGQAIADATVKLTRPDKGDGPSPAKTNKKGFWAAQGLAGGNWNVDITAPGYEAAKQSAAVSEGGGGISPQLQTQLQKSVAAAPQAAEAAAPENNQGAEVVAAVNEGNRLLGEKKYAEARAEYEKALAILPDNAALWKGIAQTYHGEGNKDKMIDALKKTTQLDPNDTDSRILLASILLDAGQLDEGKATLESLPPGAVKDPAVYINIAVTLMNKSKPQDAVTYLTKAVELDPAQPDAYYYRGLANIQMKKNAEAKADFHKYLEIAPNGSEAKEVQEMLQAIK